MEVPPAPSKEEKKDDAAKSDTPAAEPAAFVQYKAQVYA